MRTFWRKVRWWLAPLGSSGVYTVGKVDVSLCEFCGHLNRHHFGDHCFAHVGPTMADCGNCRLNDSQARTEQMSALSDEQEFTK